MHLAVPLPAPAATLNGEVARLRERNEVLPFAEQPVHRQADPVLLSPGAADNGTTAQETVRIHVTAPFGERYARGMQTPRRYEAALREARAKTRSTFYRPVKGARFAPKG